MTVPGTNRARRGSIALGRLIERRRSELSLGQAAFARRIGVSQQTVSRWERGESVPQRTHLYDLADVLGLDLDALVDDGVAVAPAPPPGDPAALEDLAAAVDDAIRALARVQAAMDALAGTHDTEVAPDELAGLLAATPQSSVAEERAVVRAAARRLADQARQYRSEAAQARERARRRRGA